MRVLHVLTTNQRRGAELSAMTLRAELEKRGHQAVAVALAEADHGPFLDIPVLGTGRRLGVASLKGLRRRAADVDVVLAHGSTTLPACAMALMGSRTRFVYANIGDPLYWADTRRRQLRVRALMSRAHSVAARSEQSRQILQSRFGVPGDRVRVISNGRDVARFAPASEKERLQARRALGLPPAGPVVVYVGALAPEKRVDVAIRAVGRLPGTALVVAGDGPESPTLKALADEAAPGQVHFLGQVADVPAVLHAADALVLTSDSEGLPGSLIEAGLCGLPVVSTEVGFVGDIVVDGVTGVLVPADDHRAAAAALVHALAHPEMGALARKRCLTLFDMQQVAQLWEDLLSRATRRA